MATEHARISYGQGGLLPHMVDRLARETPDAAYGVWPVLPESYKAGFRTVTYSQFVNVVDGLAWWLVEQLGPGHDNEVLTYVGPNDVRLTALVLAATKTGYVTFLTSPRNSHAAHRALFAALKCRTLVTTDPTPPAALAILEAVKPRQLIAPSVKELLGRSYPPYSFTKTFEELRSEPVFIIHTSGSTGLPKPLIWTHETVARHQNFFGRSPPDGTQSLDQHFSPGKRVMVTLPPFHGAGLAQYLLNAIPFGSIPVVPASVALTTAQGLVDALKQTPADVALLVPSIVSELAQNPALLEYCADHLEVILYIGGDLPQSIGDRVASKMPLRCLWGASETGIPHQLKLPELGPLDWRYISFHPCIGAVYDEFTEGTYELVIRRENNIADTQPAFTIKGQERLEEYRTKDLFEAHPTVHNAWCWRARVDDIIVFINGEKTNPVSMEQYVVASNPELSGAIVIGAQRFQAALLIEPVAPITTTAEQAALIERVWPSIEVANREAPAHAKVVKSLVFVTVPDRPLIRAGKGTLQRAASIAQYGPEIEEQYRIADSPLDDDAIEDPLDLSDTNAVTHRLEKGILNATGWSGIDEVASFFEQGMDSLQALELVRALRRSLHQPDISLSTLYQHPTVSQLTAAIMSQNHSLDDRDSMESLLATYRDLIHQLPKPKSFAPSNEKVVNVILTGSTGTIGTFILHALLSRPGIGHVYCLNRAQDGGRAAQGDRFAANRLGTDVFEDRVTFLHADTAHPLLGLDAAIYETLRDRSGLVIHNAWPVNFHLGLSAFRKQLAGLVNLFALSASAAPRTMKILFTSSVSAVGGRPAEAGPAPEAIFESFETPFSNGYARSKFLSELLCDAAARHLGIPVSVARVGQVAGSIQRSGLWNRAEWLPSLIISSLYMGCLPDSLGTQFSEIDWIPSDLLAEVLLDLATRPSLATEDAAGALVFNVRNPTTTTWDALLPTIQDATQTHLGRISELVPPSIWLARLQENVATATENNSDLSADAASNPAIKLLGFYRDGLWAHGTAPQPFLIDRARATSLALRDMPPVSLDWMRKWVDEWISGGT